MKAKLLYSEDIDKNAWDAIIDSSPQGSIFVKSWLLEAQLGKWQGIIVEGEDGIEAVMPLNIQSKYGLQYSFQPILARYWGLCYKGKTFANNREEHNWARHVSEALISAIPHKLTAFRHYFNPNYSYGLPFYWKGYHLNVRYTNIINLEQGYEKVHKEFSSTARNEISKAQRSGLIAKNESNLSNLKRILQLNEDNNKLVLAQKHFPMMERVAKVCMERGQCISKSVWFEDKAVLSSLCFFDKKSTYFITHNIDPSYKHLRATPLLISEILKEAQMHSSQFDFLGSMIENIETSFKKFGTISVPYLDINKVRKPFHLIL